MSLRPPPADELDWVPAGDVVSPPALEAATLDLAGASVRVESNSLGPILARFHRAHLREASAPFDWRFVLVERPLAEPQAREMSRDERVYRADTLARGLVVGHHLTGPIGMRTLGRREYVFAGRGMATLFWSLLLKVMLTLHAAREGAVHLKAVGVDVDDRALLMVGRSRSAKTAVGMRLHELGCDLIANTHVIWRSDGVTGLATAVRTRTGGREHETPAEELRWCRRSRPVGLLVALTGADVPAPAICYGGRGFWPLVLYFGLGTVNYDLKEDVCDFADSLEDGLALLAREDALLERLVERTPTVEITLDPRKRRHVEQVADELRTTLGR